jgi:outer membrane biosynthesis protein TonB
MLKLSLLSLSLAACATTGATTLDRDAAPRAKVKLDLAAAGADSAFPSAVDPQLPAVDRIARAVRLNLGGTATAELDLCVTPTGAVKHLRLVRGSSYTAFDQALLRDAAAWQFASLPGPDHVMSCSRATVAYHVH